MIARRRGGIHRDDHFRPRRPDHADDAIERVFVVPHLFGQRGADRIVKIDLVEVVDVLNPGDAHGAPFFVLPEQTEGGAFLGPDGVAATLATGDRDHANLNVGVLMPLAIGGQAERFVVGMGANEEHIELGFAIRVDVDQWRRIGRRFSERRRFRCRLPGSGRTCQ